MRLPPSPAFDRYVDAARQGRTGLWRLSLGMVLVAAVWIGWTVAVVVGSAALTGRADAVFEPGERPGGGPNLGAFFDAPDGVAVMLATFAALWLGIWLAVRLLQRRPLRSLLGGIGGLSWDSYGRGLIAALLVFGLFALVHAALDPSVARGPVSFGTWLAWLFPFLVLLFVQTSGEEALFRGFLLQSLAARFASPLIWAGLPALLFMAVHWQSGAPLLFNVASLLYVLGFALATSALVYVSGDLGAAMGAHLGANAVAVLGVTSVPWTDSISLYVHPFAADAGWSSVLLLSAGQLAAFALILLLLLHPRSPLRLRSPAAS